MKGAAEKSEFWQKICSHMLIPALMGLVTPSFLLQIHQPLQD